MQTNQNTNIPCITMTVIFEGSALNRNEKIGGNILSVKKLNINGEERTYLSKGAIRHYLFNTLVRAKGWKEAKILPDGQVLQFDIDKDDILTCEELDVFGYMNTTRGQTRKTPLHITKAVSLFPYEQDLGMYANHDLVRRAKEQGSIDSSENPNPFNKEEHTSLYKITYTVDSDRLGMDSWIVPSLEVVDDQNKIVLKSEPKKKGKTDKDEEVDDEREEGNEVDKKSKGKSKPDLLPIKEFSFTKKETLDGKTVFDVANGTLTVGQLPNKRYKIDFQLNPNLKIKRIKDILETIHNGLIAHSSSESNTIVPLFLIIGNVKVPSPVFHSYLDVKKSNDKSFEVIGVNNALQNGWLGEKVCIENTQRLHIENFDKNESSKEIKNWDDFINNVLPTLDNASNQN